MMAQHFIPRRWLRAAFAVLLCLVGSSAVQADLISGNFTYTATATEVTITGCSLDSGAVTIPSSIAGLSVTVIDSYAFHNKYGLTSVTIPNSVTSIGQWAFDGCTGLTNLTIPNSVNSIGEGALSDCTGLTSLIIPNSITSIEQWAFDGCTSLTSMIIPSSVTSIGVSAFEGCTDLTNLTIPDSVTIIGSSAFKGCTGITSLTIPSSITSIEQLAFYGCTGLTNLTIPDSVTSIGNWAFGWCSGLTRLTVPDSVISIGDGAFGGCSGLTSLTISNSAVSIGNFVFYDCTSLTSLTIPNSVTHIGYNTFDNCTSLTSLIVPDAFLSSLSTLTINFPLASKALIDGIARNLSTNTEFINALAGNDAFVTAVANKIKSTSGNYGIATQSALSSALTESRADGINSVLSNPSLWTLYTTSQIQNMAVGDLVLTKNVQGNFTLNYDIEQSTDLKTWTPYQALSLPLTGLPTDKAFVRIKAKQ